MKKSPSLSKRIIARLAASTLLMSGLCNVAPAQAPITLSYSNYLMPPRSQSTFHVVAGPGIAAPASGENITYDYGLQPDNGSYDFNITLDSASNPDFPTARNADTSEIFYGGSGLHDTEIFYRAIDKGGLRNLGYELRGGAVSLEPFTGVATDSLILPPQSSVFPEPALDVKLLDTYGEEWRYHSVQERHLIITLAAEGLDHADLTIINENNLRIGTVGWGKMRIPTPAGPSDYIDGLLIKAGGTYYTKVLVNGNLASSYVSALTVYSSHPESSFPNNQYFFLRKGYWAELAHFFMDNTFTTVTSAWFNQSYLDIECGGGVKLCKNGISDCVSYRDANDALLNGGATLGSCGEMKTADEIAAGVSFAVSNAFPNPSAADFTVSMLKPYDAAVIVRVSDLSGKVIRQFTTSENQYTFGNELKPGIYFATIFSGKEKQVIKLVKTE